MTTNIRLVLICLLFVGCSKQGDGVYPVDVSGADASATTPQEARYVLDFSATEGGGKWIGNFQHLAFNVDLKNPVRKVTFVGAEEHVDGVLATDDLATCSPSSQGALEQRLSELQPGENAWIGDVVVDLVPPPNVDVVKGDICFGYRENGKWKWNLTKGVPIGPGQGRINGYRAIVPIQHAPVDAVKLVFGQNQELAYVREISFTARKP